MQNIENKINGGILYIVFTLSVFAIVSSYGNSERKLFAWYKYVCIFLKLLFYPVNRAALNEMKWNETSQHQCTIYDFRNVSFDIVLIKIKFYSVKKMCSAKSKNDAILRIQTKFHLFDALNAWI